MKKKILPVFLAIIIFFTSTLFQVNKTQAFFPAVIPAGAGAYTLLALGGAALLYGLGQEGTAEELESHAKNVWEKTSTGFKDIVNSGWKWVRNNAGVEELRFDPSAYTITQTDLIKSKANQVTIRANSDVYAREYSATTQPVTTSHPSHLVSEQASTIYPDGLKASIYGGELTYRIGWQYNTTWAFMVSTPEKIFFSQMVDIDGPEIKFINQGGLMTDGSIQYGSTYNIIYQTSERLVFTLGDKLLTPEQFVTRANALVASAGIHISVVSEAFIRSYQSNQTKVEEQWESVKDAGLVIDGGGIKAANPDKTFHPDGTITDTATGAAVRPGDLAIPKPVVTTDGRIGLPVAEGTIQDTLTGDKTTTGEGTGEGTVPGEGSDTGILQGLWDWLKGMLKSILDAILALGSLIGVVGLVQSILNLIETLSNSIDGWKNAPTKKIDWSKLTVAAGTLTTVFPFSIPWDVFRLFNVMNVQPITPVFEVSTNKNIQILDTNIPIKYDFDIDFGFFNPIASIGRWALILIFDISIIMALRRLTPD